MKFDPNMELDELIKARMDVLYREIETEFGPEIPAIIAATMRGVLLSLMLNSVKNGVSSTQSLAAFIKVVRSLDDLADDHLSKEAQANLNEMKIYRVHLHWEEGSIVAGNNNGYCYFANKREAEKCFRSSDRDKAYDDIDFQEIKVPLTKAGVLRALNIYGGHPDNG